MHEVVTSLDDLSVFAEKVKQNLDPHDEHATVLALTGDLGAGKTAFTKELAKHLGVAEHITSPTFVLAKTYDLSGQKYNHLIHIDAYRLEGNEGLEPTGFPDLLKDPSNLIVIEWPERIAKEVPSHAISMEITINTDGDREITYGE